MNEKQRLEHLNGENVAGEATVSRQIEHIKVWAVRVHWVGR